MESAVVGVDGTPVVGTFGCGTNVALAALQSPDSERLEAHVP